MTHKIRTARALYSGGSATSATLAIAGAACWRLANRAGRPVRPAWLREVSLPDFGGRMHLFSSDLTTYRRVVLDDYYEFHPAAVVRPEWRVVEVGGHIGLYSVSRGSRLDPTLGGRMLVFEADPGSYRVLAENVRALPAVSAVHAAVYSEAGELEFLSALRTESAHILGFGNTRGPDQFRPGETVKVEAVTLDDVADGLDRIDLLKINAEGAEMQILRGGRQRALPVTQRLLLSHEGEEPFEDVAATLLEHGLALAGSNDDQLYLFVRA